MPATKFSEVPVGTAIRSENCWGTKIEPIESEQSAAFYRSHRARFDGWNFRYKFMGFGEESLMSLAPDTEVLVLDKLPSCYAS
ncbi:MAG: hypothetical protein KGL39_00470 [Patescibacteria group bacterium]|nr:hypothetical protein [Patescibacteria group bacterium]